MTRPFTTSPMKRLLGIAIFSTDAILMAYNLNLLYGKPHVYVLSAVLQISGCCDFIVPCVQKFSDVGGEVVRIDNMYVQISKI